MLDCDGTLVDTLGDFDAALNAMLRQMRRPRIEREQIARFVGRGTEHLLRCVLALQDGGAMPDEATFNQAWAAYLQAYEQVNGTHSRLYPGVREGLAALQAQGLPLACLTNKPQAFARELMRRLGLAPFFRFIHGGDTFARKKPDPLPLLETCRLLGAPPAATLMVGDSRNDAQAARAAGCPSSCCPMVTTTAAQSSRKAQMPCCRICLPSPSACKRLDHAGGPAAGYFNKKSEFKGAKRPLAALLAR